MMHLLSVNQLIKIKFISTKSVQIDHCSFYFMRTVYSKVKDQFVCVCWFDNSTKD